MTDCPDPLGPPCEPPRPAPRRWPGGLGLSMAPVTAQVEMASASAGAGALTCPRL
jgi:hypothetical protein